MKFILAEFTGTLEESTSTANKAANFLFEHASAVITILVLLIAVVIALTVFLILLWKYYKKDELILRKYKINSANEDINELKQYNNKL